MQQEKKDFGKVAVLYGGDSAEREVSLVSGKAVYEALCAQGVDAHLLDTQNREAVLNIERDGYERAFIILHGRGGEDGQIQGVLEWLGVPYTGSGIMACSVGMDKVMTKQIWASYGLPVLKDFLLSGDEDYQMVCQRLNATEFAVKPALEGSSVGISRVSSESDWQQALKLAGVGEQKVMVEQWIVGRELTSTVVDGEVLPIIEVAASDGHDFYDFEAKYHADDTSYLCPAPIDDELTKEVQYLTKRAFDTLGASGWGRVDFMIDENNRPWLLEVNLVPGMTSHSLVPQAAAKIGIDFEALVLKILAQTLVDKR